ncbi:acyltransferase domain-containing protein, partial [Streptomyces beijiangensis]
GESVADLPWAQLDAQEPAFGAALDAVEEEAHAALGISVRASLLEHPSEPIALVALQIALAALWRDHGVQPDALIARGPGEIAAAHVAGVLTLHDALIAAVG